MVLSGCNEMLHLTAHVLSRQRKHGNFKKMKFLRIYLIYSSHYLLQVRLNNMYMNNFVNINKSLLANQYPKEMFNEYRFLTSKQFFFSQTSYFQNYFTKYIF